MKFPLLTICIATYNRASYIGETLESIIPELDEDVEVLVVDGASTDNTEAVVREFAQKEPLIRYIRLSTKGGVDKDYDKAVELARGEFCWLFTDDDLLKPGAIPAVKAAINDGHDFVVVNAEVRDSALSILLEKRRINIQDNKTYTLNSMEQLFIDSLHYLSFIGAVVIRRSVWMGRERRIYYGTEFVHVGVIFQKLLPGSALIIAEPFIIIRFGNGQWTPRSFDIWMFKWPKLVWSFKDFSSEAKRSVTSKEPWRNIKKLISQRSEGSYNLQTYRQYLSTMQINVLWKFCALLVSCLPRNIAFACYYLYSRRNKEAREYFDKLFVKR